MDEYFNWMVGIIDPEHQHSKYSQLLTELDHHIFKWDPAIPTDENRGEDGKELRWWYSDETGRLVIDRNASTPCTVLEMMIMLSIRIDNMVADPRTPDLGHLFWAMIDNLGLSYMTNSKFSPAVVKTKLFNWMERMYDDHGRGGAFPLKNPEYDQRFIPIWDQAFSYVSEREY